MLCVQCDNKNASALTLVVLAFACNVWKVKNVQKTPINPKQPLVLLAKRQSHHQRQTQIMFNYQRMIHCSLPHNFPFNLNFHHGSEISKDLLLQLVMKNSQQNHKNTSMNSKINHTLPSIDVIMLSGTDIHIKIIKLKQQMKASRWINSIRQ